jgi:hypothetical protein
MAEIVLQSAGIHAFASQASAMAKHVDMHREGQFGSLASSLDHSTDAHATKRLPALIDEYIGRLEICRFKATSSTGINR